MPPAPEDAPDYVRVPVAVLVALRDMAAEIELLRERVGSVEEGIRAGRDELAGHVREVRPVVLLAQQVADRALRSATETAGDAAGMELAATERRRAAERTEAEVRAAFHARLRTAGYAIGVIAAVAIAYYAGHYLPAPP